MEVSQMSHSGVCEYVEMLPQGMLQSTPEYVTG